MIVRLCMTSALLLSLVPAVALAQPSPPPKPDAKPGDAKPADAKPADAKPPETKPPPAKPAGQKKPAEPALPPAAARLWIVAPAAEGTWTFRIDNEGERPIRVPADVRLLRFEVDTPDGKKTKKVKCAPPAGFRPDRVSEARALLLAPGESYIESFDPKLVCFGKDAAALTGGATVRARFGWDPPPKWSKKPPEAPFAAEGTQQPPTAAAVRELVAPTMVLSYAVPPPPPPRPPEKPKTADPSPDASSKTDKGTKPADKPDKGPKTAEKAPEKSPEKAADKPPDKTPDKPPDKPPEKPPIEDANAPKLELTAGHYDDAGNPRQVSVTVTVTNVGHRDTTAALRSRMISFRVEGPDRRMSCDEGPVTKSIPRDMYRTLKPKQNVSFTVLLAEVCPKDAFGRAGMYRVDATLHANESGSELGLQAYTGVSDAPTPTIVRVLDAPEPFYSGKPKAVPTPKLEPRDDVIVTGE